MNYVDSYEEGLQLIIIINWTDIQYTFECNTNIHINNHISVREITFKKGAQDIEQFGFFEYKILINYNQYQL